MKREQLRHLAVAGTVTFPATYPRLAEIRLRRERNLAMACGEQEATFLVAIERPAARVTLKRIMRVCDVRAVFIPRNPRHVDLNDGTWLLGPEIEVGIRLQRENIGCVYGIVYVAEQTSTLLKVDAGMTAAESSQYYPPLPVDRSVNHYDPFRSGQGPALHPRSAEAHAVTGPDSFYCEPDYPPPTAEAFTYCEPDYPPPPAPAAYCEPDYSQPKPYQTLQQSQDVEPAPYPTDEDQP